VSGCEAAVHQGHGTFVLAGASMPRISNGPNRVGSLARATTRILAFGILRGRRLCRDVLRA